MVIDISKLTEKSPIDVDINYTIDNKTAIGSNLQKESTLYITGKLSKQEDKGGDLYIFSLQVSGSLVFLCDLCTSVTNVPIKFSIEEIIKKPENINRLDEDADVIWVTNTKLDIAPLFSSYFYKELPRRALCSDNCAGLCKKCGADLNKVVCGCTEKEAETDSRFDMLKNLKFDN